MNPPLLATAERILYSDVPRDVNAISISGKLLFTGRGLPCVKLLLDKLNVIYSYGNIAGMLILSWFN